jgi:hypothetical protein
VGAAGAHWQSLENKKIPGMLPRPGKYEQKGLFEAMTETSMIKLTL